VCHARTALPWVYGRRSAGKTAGLTTKVFLSSTIFRERKKKDNVSGFSTLTALAFDITTHDQGKVNVSPDLT
jgi:hypothetical protein